MKLTFPIFIIFFLFCSQLKAQIKDSSIKINMATVVKVSQGKNPYAVVLDSNIFLTYKGTPQALAIKVKKQQNVEYLFYIFTALFLLLGLLRSLFSRYFTTMFRVFFNTSLRQNQLTDQLEQATLPSLFFNIFFVLSIGLYIYILNEHNKIYFDVVNWTKLMLCVLAVAICYLVKYISLLFAGWLTNYKAEAKIYIFSIFLLNKIIGIVLLPFTILIGFSTNKIAHYATVVSLILLLVLLFTRFFKTYGLLQHKLKLNRIHFLTYIVCLEILPILIIYKTVVVFFGINS